MLPFPCLEGGPGVSSRRSACHAERVARPPRVSSLRRLGPLFSLSLEPLGDALALVGPVLEAPAERPCEKLLPAREVLGRETLELEPGRLELDGAKNATIPL